MAKGIGLIGNFRGKVGNMVGYNLKDSNNKQTQGVRVYQPVVKNPKTYGQAEQRAKLAPINATYRALKAIIDRGQEGKAYGNKSRLAWLSDAMKAFNGGWFEKGAAITAPALVPLTKGSLSNPVKLASNPSSTTIEWPEQITDVPTTLSELAELLIESFPGLQEGDQITMVQCRALGDSFLVDVKSILLDTNATASLPDGITVNDGGIYMGIEDGSYYGGAIILSREGSNGAHLRSSESIVKGSEYPATTQGDAAKEAAIKSYMSAGANTDWAEESLQ